MSERSSAGAAVARRRAGQIRPTRAAALVAAVLAAWTAGAAAQAPITLALFEFELEDFTADAPASGQRPSDAVHLARVTDEVRRLLAQSGRYRLVDV
ncbi:DUF2380 domain-containing protein, partial [Azospirillum sp. A39]|uniref:DUF2380 domain-containing protein n=1 Tax=Azospirillum sp. A39 TaxID=3462279 RepID=UPI004046346D